LFTAQRLIPILQPGLRNKAAGGWKIKDEEVLKKEEERRRKTSTPAKAKKESMESERRGQVFQKAFGEVHDSMQLRD
jgi:hypothetical protein